MDSLIVKEIFVSPTPEICQESLVGIGGYTTEDNGNVVILLKMMEMWKFDDKGYILQSKSIDKHVIDLSVHIVL